MDAQTKSEYRTALYALLNLMPLAYGAGSEPPKIWSELTAEIQKIEKQEAA